jgi:outer membrane protein assembly factor BamE (lipoprotein component of BamABCDE complex)
MWRNGMKKLMFMLVTGLFVLSLAGCLTVQELKSGVQWDNNALFLIEKGKTTAKDIAYSFGSPQKEIIGGEKGRIWIYFYDNAKYIFEGAINHGIVEGEHNALTIWFNKDGIVTDLSYTYNKFEDPTKKKWADRIEGSTQNQGGQTQ